MRNLRKDREVSLDKGKGVVTSVKARSSTTRGGT